MENFPQLVPLIVVIPAIGAFINIFWGPRLSEKAIGYIATGASALSFVVAWMLYSYLLGNNFQGVVVNPPILDWIRIDAANVNIPWQMRVDGLSVTMMLIITGIGTLIHIYCIGYMHGDSRFHRFFAYLNMFLAFMLILVTANNFLMLFVGWEGVGVCSFLLIGFWFDKARGIGWKNSNAARKAFILNRVGDFGMLMAIFLTFWTFGTLDFYRPGEIANPHFEVHGAEHGEADAGHIEGGGAIGDDHGAATTDDHGTTTTDEHGTTTTTDEHSTTTTDEHSTTDEHGTTTTTDDHGTTATTDDHGAAVDTHGAAADDHGTTMVAYSYEDHDIATRDLGVFGQAERLLHDYEAGAAERAVDFGPFSLDLSAVITLITLFLLLGATGKSAQIPLFVWLPDAMAGPTPASALIHAATMVTAGVYMMVRSSAFFYNAPVSSFVVTLIGVSTALIAGFIAMGQWDIKRVLAYSTVSQLGFMVAAVGIGAYTAAIFHLFTHAFFKALLFLGSGSVIHAVEHGHHHAHEHAHGHGHDAHDSHGGAKVYGHDAHDAHDEHAQPGDHPETTAKKFDEHPDHQEPDFDAQDMRNMGGLSKNMRITYITYLIGTLALAGIFPFAGFWSKDEILADSWVAGVFDNNLGGFIALGGLLLAAGFTAFYMWRQIELVFHGSPRTEAARLAPESSWWMLVPLIVLAFFSVFAGFANTPDILFLDDIFGLHGFSTFLGSSVPHAHIGEFQLLIALAALGLALGAIFLARTIYGNNRGVVQNTRDPLQANAGFAPIWNIANARMYWDQFYGATIEQPFNRTAKFLADRLDWDFWHDYFHDTIIFKGFNAIAGLLGRPVDLGIIDGAVNGMGRLVRWMSSGLRQVQTGYVRTYAISLLLGVVLVIVLLLLPLLQRALAAGN